LAPLDADGLSLIPFGTWPKKPGEGWFCRSADRRRRSWFRAKRRAREIMSGRQR
jgi:hypothetical protein